MGGVSRNPFLCRTKDVVCKCSTMDCGLQLVTSCKKFRWVLKQFLASFKTVLQSYFSSGAEHLTDELLQWRQLLGLYQIVCLQWQQSVSAAATTLAAGALIQPQRLAAQRTFVKYMKCLKQVFKCASSPSAQTCLKWVWYMWAYTRNRRLKMAQMTLWNVGGKGSP